MRILATGGDLGSCAHQSGFSPSGMRKFFHVWCEWFVRHYYAKKVYWPSQQVDVEAIESVYSRLGLPGCISSMDGVHLSWDNTPAYLRSAQSVCTLCQTPYTTLQGSCCVCCWLCTSSHGCDSVSMWLCMDVQAVALCAGGCAQDRMAVEGAASREEAAAEERRRNGKVF